MESRELCGVAAGDAAKVGGVEVRGCDGVTNGAYQRPAACWRSGGLDDLTERQDHRSEPRYRAVLAASHVKLCLHEKTPLWPFWWLLAARKILIDVIADFLIAWFSKYVRWKIQFRNSGLKPEN